MYDPSEQVIFWALSRLASAADGLPVFGTKSRPGLFLKTNQGKRAAELARTRSLLAIMRQERRGRTNVEICRLTETGREFLASCLASLREAVKPGDGDWTLDVVTYLRRRQETGTIEDCPLPDLFKLARTGWPDLTIGQFHDGLRSLHERELIYLHPWTGPRYDLPEPALALLVGHEIVYYASARVAHSLREWVPAHGVSGLH